MPPLRIEVARQSEDLWREAGNISPGDPYGSISDNNVNGRDVYYFGIDLLEGTAVIKKSEIGIDVATSKTRIVHALGGTSLVASLRPGEQHEITVRTDSGSKPLRVRFTHLDE